MKIILKGIMAPKDAVVAIQHVIDAILMSKNGAQQLDRLPSTLEVLPRIAAAVKRRIPVLFDGVIKRGCTFSRLLLWG